MSASVRSTRAAGLTAPTGLTAHLTALIVPLALALLPALVPLAPATAQEAAKDGSEAAAAGEDDPVARLAGAYQLTNADGDRVCPLALAPTPLPAAKSQGGTAKSKEAAKDANKQASGAPHLLTLTLDRAECAGRIPFSADIAAWSTGPGDAIRLHAASGKLIAEFTEGVGGTWEALREKDGVYFLVNPKLAAAITLEPNQIFGTWTLSRTTDSPGCSVLLGEDALANGNYTLSPEESCAKLFGDFEPVSWQVEKGDLVLYDDDDTPMRFAVQEDGSWSKVPEDTTPLVLFHHP